MVDYPIALTCNSGSIALVTAPSVANLRSIRQYYQFLSTQVRQLENFWLPEAEPILTEQFLGVYQSIGNLFRPALKVTAFTPQSRHGFFVAREPIAHPAMPDTLTPGLSWLEEILGYAYEAEQEQGQGKERSTSPIPTVALTTGEYELDIIATACMVFKEQAAWLCDRFDAATLTKLIQQAGLLSQGEEAIQKKQAELDRQWFEENQKAIEEAAIRYGVMPLSSNG